MRASVAVRREVAPGRVEGSARSPSIATRVVDVHLIRGIRCSSTTPQDPHLVIDHYRACLGSRSRYVCDRCPGIGHRIVLEGVGCIRKGSAVGSRTAAGVDYPANVRRGNIPTRHGVIEALEPARSRRRSRVELPGLRDHVSRDLKAADDVELI